MSTSDNLIAKETAPPKEEPVPTGGFANLLARLDFYGLDLTDGDSSHIAIDSDPVTTPSEFLHSYLPKFELVKKLQQGEIYKCLLIGPCYYSASQRTLIVYDPCFNGGCAAYATWVMKCVAEQRFEDDYYRDV